MIIWNVTCYFAALDLNLQINHFCESANITKEKIYKSQMQNIFFKNSTSKLTQSNLQWCSGKDKLNQNYSYVRTH